MQHEVIKTGVTLFRTDPSVFVRRAAVHFISTCWSGCCGLQSECLVLMRDAVLHGDDCDVKTAAIKFWRHYLSGVTQSVRARCCQTAVLAGGVASLMLAVSDCDRSVRVEALASLVDTRKLFETESSRMLLLERKELFEDCDRICSNPDFTVMMRNLPQNFEYEISVDGDRGTMAVNSDVDAAAAADDDDGMNIMTKLRSTLLSTNWDCLLASESQQSDDCHAGNPASLLDDILSTSCRASHENVDDANDGYDSVVMDCY